MCEIVAKNTSNHGMGPPYHPSMKTTLLIKTKHPHHITGKRFYLEMESNGCSRTWLSDQKAMEIQERWEQK